MDQIKRFEIIRDNHCLTFSRLNDLDQRFYNSDIFTLKIVLQQFPPPPSCYSEANNLSSTKSEKNITLRFLDPSSSLIRECRKRSRVYRERSYGKMQEKGSQPMTAWKNIWVQLDSLGLSQSS